MASAAAQRAYGAAGSPKNADGSTPDLDAWFQNAVNAGVFNPDGSTGGQQNFRESGASNYSAGATGASGLQPGSRPNPDQLRKYAKEQGWSEDFNRFDDATLQQWINNSWDPQAMKFHSEHGGALVEKPSETGPGETMGGGGGGGGGGGAGGGGGGGGFGQAGGVPQFNAPKFTAPGYQDMLNDPGYQARLQQDQTLLEHNQAAKGLARSGGSLADLMQYGQDFASNEYNNTYGRAANTYGLNYQAAKDEFAPQYGGWQTQYGGDLSRWTTNQNAALQKYLGNEQNIYGALMGGMPTMGSYGGGY